MPSQTPVLKLPYPLGTDPVAGGDDAIKALAERIEARMPLGNLGHVESTVTQGVTGSADLTFLIISPTVGTGRRVRVTAYADVTGPATANTTYLRIQEGATVLQVARATLPASGVQTLAASVVLTPTAGAHTYKATAQCAGGTATVGGAPGSPAFLLVEDLGPVSLA